MRKTWTDEQLIEAVKRAHKMMDVSKQLGLKNLGRNYTTLNKHIKRLNLDTSHFLNKQELIAQARKNIAQLTNDDLFSKNTIDRKHIKRTIIKQNLIDYACAICKINDWQDQPLTLHLDHIDGDNQNNELSNLRFLCPNCHSQTNTYCGRNIRI